MTGVAHARARWASWWRKAGAWLRRAPPRVDEHQQARDLIAAVDAGGIPLNPAKVNAIARQLGLEVSTRARMEDTLERIRSALERLPPPGT